MFVLTALKHGGKCDYLRRPFAVSDPTFYATVIRFIDVIKEELYDCLVLN